MEAQKRLFEIIKSKINVDKYRLSDFIEELLNVSTDSAYRRIRGETELSFSELQKICGNYNLSMDNILNYKSNHSVLFHYTAVDFSNQVSYINYYNIILYTTSISNNRDGIATFSGGLRYILFSAAIYGNGKKNLKAKS